MKASVASTRLTSHLSLGRILQWSLDLGLAIWIIQMYSGSLLYHDQLINTCDASSIWHQCLLVLSIRRVSYMTTRILPEWLRKLQIKSFSQIQWNEREKKFIYSVLSHQCFKTTTWKCWHVSMSLQQHINMTGAHAFKNATHTLASSWDISQSAPPNTGLIELDLIQNSHYNLWTCPPFYSGHVLYQVSSYKTGSCFILQVYSPMSHLPK